MSWKKNFAERIADILRFLAYLFLAFDAIVLSVFLFWFVVKLTWHFAQWLNHQLFSGPWF